MSEIKSKLQEDVKVAMKARDKERLTTLRGLSAAIKQIEVDERIEVDDSRIIEVFNKELKKRRDSLSFAREANREDMIQQNEAEIKIIQSYLGEELTEEKLREVISNLISDGADSIGAVMGSLNKSYKGRFEGKVASAIIKDSLG